jgi:anthranilate phosphoribosyltransferase
MEWMTIIAESLQRLGAVHVMIVHSHEGLCDLTITGESEFIEWVDGKIRGGVLRPQRLGLAPAPLDALRVSDPQQSGAVIREILDGQAGPRRNHTLLNAAAALVVAGIAADLGEGVALAAKAIDSGAAAKVLDRLIEITKEAR